MRICRNVPGVVSGEGDEAVGVHEGERAHDAQEQAGGHDRRDDGHEDVSEELDGAHEGVGLLLRGGLLHLRLGGGSYVAEGDELVVDLVHRAGSVDDLQLAGRLEVALGARGVVNGGLVDLRVVREHEAQARRAVRGRDHVAGSADGVQYLLSRLPVVECHCFSSLRLT